MKKILLLIGFILHFAVFSQQKTFKITWQDYTTIATEKFSFEVPYFNKEHFNYSLTDGLQFVAQWEIASLVNESSVALSQVTYASISKNELKGVNLKSIPKKIQYTLSNSIARDVRHAYLEVSPIINDNGVYKKVTSFTVNYDNRSSSRYNGATNRAISNSVLSSGEWYKFYVDTTGVFKITKDFLSSIGVNTNNVDPRNIKLYGNGGKMIPYANSEPYPYDLAENAIRIVGESDGQFDNNDYILFYAQGPKGYSAESNTHINLYSDVTYYYINISPGQGKRIQPFIQPSGPVDLEIDNFQDYQFHEVDEHNIVNVGRRWFGEKFDIENEQTFNFSMPDLITSEPLRLKVYVASDASTASSMQLNANGANITTLNLAAATNETLAVESVFNGDINVNSGEIAVQLNYNNAGNPSANAYLDYISIEGTRALNYSGNQFSFRNKAVATSTGIGRYTITNASNVSEIWEITDLYNVTTAVNTEASNTFSFTSNLGSLKEYVVVGKTGYFEPIMASNSNVANQDLKGTIFLNEQGNFEDIDYLIVTPTFLVNQAQRLADINKLKYNLNVKVVTLGKIYNEFSSGSQDIGAIRNFVKYIYDNASSPEKRLKYLCLFGDGSVDYKDRLQNNTNIVPSWHAMESFNLTNSFVSDDFFGMMDDNEGAMSSSDKLDIAVGRILVSTTQQAREVVDKIISYHSEESYDSWRNSFVMISDDVDLAWERTLQETTDRLSDNISAAKPFLNATKIHSDAFLQEASAGGDRYPKVTEAINNAVEKGALVVNYFGHGGEDGLGHERFYDQPMAKNFGNTCKLNCFVTVTCEFTRFDNPLRPTAGEFTFWNPDGGAVSLITTTRQIFVSVGVTFNEVLSEYMFSYNDTDEYQDHEYPSIAEALRLTKNSPSISNVSQRRLIFFIGDPAMKLSFPKPSIRLTKINDVPVEDDTDTLQALGRVKLSGEVTDLAGNVLTNYNGVLSTTIYDKEIDRRTLANDRTRDGGALIYMDFKTLGEIIFRGQASITNGQFEFEFVVPRDISIPVGFGKASFYAKSEIPFLQDQTGASIETIKIGGINNDAPEDNVGPLVTLFMNDESFVSGGITNESPTLLVKLEDENGINTASGIGHDIVAIIDGDETNPFILNDYYQTEVDDYTKGTVSYPFRNLSPGLHTLTLKAWDVYNNSTTQEIQFVVYNENEQLVVDNVLNYPNPFVNYTEFWFNHNSSEPLDVSVQIFTVSGKLVRTINGQTNASDCCGGSGSALSRDIVWDGRDDFGDKIGKGVYVYKLTVRSNTLNKKVEKIEKLVIL
ncbi:peptidase C25-like protein [Oceanihabitans sediminis]|uniref:Peptidase C25 n=1 Tax=Oceanihabitans sediminis TaxID=1812012 RepID=A0A368P664_9FLAO|nr:type IX secretion system sortase PorU [Oceanihabitans sediminis]RBP29947.1 peptidase C25-like protein [Oceanihabitans sediminis]RCU57279.1 peptidase C25 [Oceanihabitans sediminis]